VYISTTREADAAAVVPRRGGVLRAVAANVVALGAVSLVTDVSSEMVTAVLPLYLIVALGLSPLQFGLLDGLYAGATVLVRLVGGHVADRWQRRKLVAGFGYGLSAICKLGLLAAGRSAVGIGAVLAVDRVGKGVRTPPRDALITLSSAPGDLGRSFGVHRAMDTAGALMGPLVAFAVLWAAPGAYDAVFVVSFCVALFGVLLLVAFVRDRPVAPARTPVRDRRPEGAARQASVRAALGLLGGRAFRRLCVGALLLGLVTVSDSFIYLLLQRRLDIGLTYFPLLPVGTAGSFLLLAVPLGRLADRVGARAVFLGGHVALLGAYLLLLLAPASGGFPLLIGVLALHGAFYAATDGVLMAAAGPMLPGALRTSGLALLQSAQALARLASSVLVGAVWTVWGMRPTIATAALALGVALLVAWPLLRTPFHTGAPSNEEEVAGR
jgi:MFS family permease